MEMIIAKAESPADYVDCSFEPMKKVVFQKDFPHFSLRLYSRLQGCGVVNGFKVAA